MPHSQFLELDADDRAKAMAFVIEDASRCDLCGTSEWEWEENKRAYAPVEHMCMGCYMKDVYSRDIDDRAPGTMVRLVPTGTVDHAKRLVRERREAMRQ